jgi:hypothetical protein
MSLADDLLEQARHLAAHDRTRPRQASLRRAVSTAYYALFRELVEDASGFLVRGNTPHREGLRAMLERCVNHRSITQASSAFASASSPWISPNQRVSDDLRAVCDAFPYLQNARHEADYGRRTFLRSEAGGIIERAVQAVVAWRRIRATPEAESFKVALFWPRRRP